MTAPSTPTREDVADILEEVGAQPDDNGGLIASEDAVREIGAMDPESVRENRRVEEVVAKKRANVKDVSFGINEPIALYDGLLKLWHVNTIDISVRRLTGSPVQHMITSRPQSGAALYEALRGIHGQYEEAEYEVKFHDSARKQWRGQGRIVMPDTRSQQGSPMNPFNPYGVPPGYPPGYPAGYPPAAPPPGYPQQPAPSPQQAAAPQQATPPQPQPVVVQPPDVSSMLTQLQQAFEFFKSMQQPPPAAPAPVAAPQPLPLPFYPPPAGIGMGELQQMLEFFRSMQQPVAGAAPPSPPMPQQPAAPPPNPMMLMGMPPMQPPPGTMWVPGIGFVPIERLMAAINPVPDPPPFRRRPMREPYYPNDDERPPPMPYYPREREPAPPQEPPRTAEQQLRETVSIIRTAAGMAREISALTGQQMGPSQQEAYEPPEDDSPISVIQAGPAKLVINKKTARSASSRPVGRTCQTFSSGWASNTNRSSVTPLRVSSVKRRFQKGSSN